MLSAVEEPLGEIQRDNALSREMQLMLAAIVQKLEVTEKLWEHNKASISFGGRFYQGRFK